MVQIRYDLTDSGGHEYIITSVYTLGKTLTSDGRPLD